MAGSTAAAEARRETIEETLRRSPGLSFRQVCKATHIPAGTTRHHLNVLVRQRRIWYTALGNRLMHFVGRKPQTPLQLREAVVTTFDGVDGRIYLAVRDEGPLPQKDILARFDEEPQSTVQHRVKRLVRLGILDERAQGRYRFYSVAEAMA
jgi:predicted transcriptional regulator